MKEVWQVCDLANFTFWMFESEDLATAFLESKGLTHYGGKNWAKASAQIDEGTSFTIEKFNILTELPKN